MSYINNEFIGMPDELLAKFQLDYPINAFEKLGDGYPETVFIQPGQAFRWTMIREVEDETVGCSSCGGNQKKKQWYIPNLCVFVNSVGSWEVGQGESGGFDDWFPERTTDHIVLISKSLYNIPKGTLLDEQRGKLYSAHLPPHLRPEDQKQRYIQGTFNPK